MIPLLVQIWPQPIAPIHSLPISALAAMIPLLVVLLLMGLLQRSGLLASACGLASAGILAMWAWGMPARMAGWSVAYGFAYAVWSILWIVFNALWLYNLAVEAGSFELLRKWMEHHASGEECIQAILVAFCFGALLEGTAGFGAPVAVTAFLLVGLGFKTQKAVVVSLIANTAPVAFGALGVPIVALAGVTGLDLAKLSAMVGRQLPLLSLILPAYIAIVVGGWKGLRRSWPVALVAGFSFAGAQFLVSNLWGPYATDIASSLVSIACVTVYLRIGKADRLLTANRSGRIPFRDAFRAWWPWIVLSGAMILWSYFRLFQKGQIQVAIPVLHNGILITLYQKVYAAIFTFQPLTGGTAVLAAIAVTALSFGMHPRVILAAGTKTLRQLRLPGLTVLFIVGLAYLYNYSGMAYTLGAALARTGAIFPLVSSFLGWVACFLSGSDTASNLLFGNLQVAAAHELHLSPLLMAATNSSGAVTGKMISPQNIAIGVTTVGMVGKEGKVLRATFWHSVLLAAFIGVLAYAQVHFLARMVP
ncbi:MAG TPA: L-lactate permease [Candidatus Acidoferrales bacterium]|nr:L-lactate permease [Candidatus Acidoferrales bacterium]